jgi:hypothetical protein
MGAATIERDPPNTGITDVVELHGAVASNMDKTTKLPGNNSNIGSTVVSISFIANESNTSL